MSIGEQVSYTNDINGSSYESVASVIKQKYTEKTNQQDFEILSTIRYDPNLMKSQEESKSLLNSTEYFLFEEHLHRFNAALDYFEWNFDISRELLLSELKESMKKIERKKPYKLRVLVSRNKRITIEAYETKERENLYDGLFESTESPCWKVFIDSTHTSTSPFTSFKTTVRDHYNLSRKRVLDMTLPMGSPQEVLIYNSEGLVMEGSITNVAFKRKSDGKWITPPLSTGCLCGVVRNKLLCQKVIEEEHISLNDLSIGDDVLLFNGINGVVRGKICSATKQ